MRPRRGRKERQMAVGFPGSGRGLVEVEIVDLPAATGSLRLPRPLGRAPVRRGALTSMLRTFAGGTLFGSVTGPDAPRVLALHGWARTHRDFDAVLAPVDEAPVPALALDLPGFGASPPPPEAWGAAAYAQAVGECPGRHGESRRRARPLLRRPGGPPPGHPAPCVGRRPDPHRRAAPCRFRGPAGAGGARLQGHPEPAPDEDRLRRHHGSGPPALRIGGLQGGPGHHAPGARRARSTKRTRSSSMPCSAPST